MTRFNLVDSSLENFKKRLDRMREEVLEHKLHQPSDYWMHYVSFFEYVFSWYPEVMDNLRYHTDMISGVHPRRYIDVAKTRPYKERLIESYKELSGEMPDFEQFSEPKMLGGFGFNFNGKLINEDLLRYMNMIRIMRNVYPFSPDTRCRILEIGGGWGGLAYQIKKHCSGVNYILVDLPYTLYFAVYYLYRLNPSLRLWVYSRDEDPAKFLDYDFIFLPPWALEAIPKKSIDIAINQSSLGEMTEKQVGFYSENLARITKIGLVSENRRMANPFNEELHDLKKLLSHDFIVRDINLPSPKHSSRRVLGYIKNRLKTVLGRAPLNEYERWFCIPRD